MTTNGVFTSIPGKPAVSATGSSGEVGVLAFSDTGNAIIATSPTGCGIFAASTEADSVSPGVIAQSEAGPAVLANSIQGFGVQAFGGGAVPLVPPSVPPQGGIFAAGGSSAGVFATNGSDAGLPLDAAVHAVSAGTTPSALSETLVEDFGLPGDIPAAMFAEGGLQYGLVVTAGPTEAELASGPYSNPLDWANLGSAIVAGNQYGPAISTTSCFGNALNAQIVSLDDINPPLPPGAPAVLPINPGVCISAINQNPALAILAGTNDNQANPTDCIAASTTYGSGVKGSTGGLVLTTWSTSAGVVGVTAGPQFSGQDVTGVMGTTISVDGIGVTADGGTLNGNPIGAVALQVQNGTIAVTSDSVGTAILAKGKKTVTVSNPAATANSLIFLTPQDDPQGFLWISAHTAGSFTIKASAAPSADVTIGFLIIN
jgi:hypothetical protein